MVIYVFISKEQEQAVRGRGQGRRGRGQARRARGRRQWGMRGAQVAQQQEERRRRRRERIRVCYETSCVHAQYQSHILVLKTQKMLSTSNSISLHVSA